VNTKEIVSSAEREGLQYLVSLGERNQAKLVELPGEPEHVYGFWNPASSRLERYTAEPGPIDYQAGSLAALRDMLLDLGRKETRVFVHSDGVTAVLNGDGDRRARVSCELQRSKAWLLLTEMCGRGFKQPELIQVLRTVLYGAADPAKFLATVRTMRFSSSSEANASIATGVSSVSASAQRQAMANGAVLPDSIEFVAAVYDEVADDPAHQHVVVCEIDVDVERQLIYVRPRAGVMTAAECNTHGLIADFLRAGIQETGALVWMGKPGD